ncbi:hypothetical protein TRIATDRAFT_296965 [Trichoderma atroviride IMI 206040]|uniref:Uncharacterized protein n=1 Tax=Hypocrea atroviridis (strain ATCC 20476 / IMI 206040) TaxID=452589 RepID=G9NF34_HYPAI|nr:uncharacterized protein TRIATDRAFT_296965 [Trichoderma atroviride IMI 206040]EHK50552.1 hypothetical protein TRIATDRAFT_296965 [Trichoderma atroviride IMI 206040]
MLAHFLAFTLPHSLLVHIHFTPVLFNQLQFEGLRIQGHHHTIVTVNMSLLFWALRVLPNSDRTLHNRYSPFALSKTIITIQDTTDAAGRSTVYHRASSEASISQYIQLDERNLLLVSFITPEALLEMPRSRDQCLS